MLSFEALRMGKKTHTEIISMTTKNLFTNQKETDRAIKAAVDQYEKYRHHSSIKRKWSRKNRTKNKRT